MMNKKINIEFSYNHYKNTLKRYKEYGYKFIGFEEAKKYYSSKNIFLLRHDVDKFVGKALDLALIENKLEIKATYFIRLHSNYYNPFGYINYSRISEIKKLGHDIALHSEFLDFAEATFQDPFAVFEKEIKMFNIAFNEKVKIYSFHRTTGANTIEEIKKYSSVIKKRFKMIGTYDEEIFDNYKYLSDSSGIWREGSFAEKIGQYERMQVLIHPEWWYKNNINLEESLV